LSLRGQTYPLSGAYQVTGPGVNPQTLEAYPEHSLVITFTPGGGYGTVNKNILAYLVSKAPGPVRLVQFAYSSEPVSEALLARAQAEYQATGKFDFLSVGDTPFAMQDWSQFLLMSGMKRDGDKFLEDPSSQWSKGLSPKQLADLRKKVFVAPSYYGTHNLKFNNKSYPVTSKIHHKLMSVGDFAVMATSFNFSSNAEKNNEQVLVFRDHELAQFVNGIAKYLAQNSAGTVQKEALRRNARTSKGQHSEETGDTVEDQVAKTAGAKEKIDASESPSVVTPGH
jgi:phosphatidylserine/phosphatidylglycerophosphate/cardiolipin synthase-like enzyme